MQFRPVVSAFFFKSCTQRRGYILIIWHRVLIAKDFCITKHAHGEAVLFLPACYFLQHTLLFEKKSMLSEFYTVYEIAICDRTCEKGPCRASFQN